VGSQNGAWKGNSVEMGVMTTVGILYSRISIFIDGNFDRAVLDLLAWFDCVTRNGSCGKVRHDIGRGGVVALD
jgi:hypothetical protein